MPRAPRMVQGLRKMPKKYSLLFVLNIHCQSSIS
jgi:hypothetical protein